MFSNIPEELRQFNSWIVWRYEAGDPKPRKVPYNPKNGYNASVTDPSHWTDFDTAVSAFKSGMYSGIGFVLSENDPFTFIDLDTPSDQETLEKQLRIAECFESYAEVSPSGSGLHIVCNGEVPTGRRKDSIEIYSKDRYMTVTGNVYKAQPVKECQSLVDMLWAELETSQPIFVSGIDEDQKYTDDQICHMAYNASNGQKFYDLYIGEWIKHYSSQSEADFALINIVGFYTQNRDQVKRIFIASELGKRDKAKRGSYLGGMISRAFDRIPPKVNLDALKADLAHRLEPQETVEEEPRPEADKSEVYAFPDGLLGDVANFIFESSPHPNKEMSLAGAIGFMSGVCGRAFNINGVGLNNYLLVLADSGVGKEAMRSGINKLFAQIVLKQNMASETFIGPSSYSSAPALIKTLMERPSIVSLMSEFSYDIERMRPRNSNPNMIGYKQALVDLYTNSGKNAIISSHAYSDKDKTTKIIKAPSFSFLGESVPERYYKNVDPEFIDDGFIPRILTFHCNNVRATFNKNCKNHEATDKMVTRISSLIASSCACNTDNKIVDVTFDADAEQMDADYEAFLTTQINEDSPSWKKAIFNRSKLKIWKLSGLVAVGINPYVPVITTEIYLWAKKIVEFDNEMLFSKVESGEIGGNYDQQQLHKVREILFKYLNNGYKLQENHRFFKDSGCIPYAIIQRNAASFNCFKNDPRRSASALDATIKTLVSNGELKELQPKDTQEKFQFGGRSFAILTIEK